MSPGGGQRRRGSVQVDLQVKRQPRLLDCSQRNSSNVSAFELEHRGLITRFRVALHDHDSSFDTTTVLRTQHVGPLTHEPPPVGAGPEGTFARRRDLQHVLRRDEPAAVETGLEGPRRHSAIVDRYRGPVAPIDANLDQRPAPRATSAKLDEVIADRIKLLHDNIFQRVLHIQSRKSSRTKKCGEPPPHFTRGHRGRAA